MAKTPPTLLQDIEAFCAATGMKESYFGKRAVGNSELVPRLRAGGRVWPETEAKARSFIISRQVSVRNRGHVPASRSRQVQPVQKSEGAV